MSNDVLTPGNDFDAFAMADLDGLYKQHEAMWTIYNESLKILVTLTSLPFLAAALFVREGKEVPSLAQILPALRPALLLTPILDIFMVLVVLNHRLSVLLYARTINGFRGLYLDKFQVEKPRFKEHVHLPTKSDRPPFYEFFGPMGAIVHGIGLVCGSYLGLLLWYGHRHRVAVLAGIGYLAFLEFLYWWNCDKYEPKSEVGADAPTAAPPVAAPAADVKH